MAEAGHDGRERAGALGWVALALALAAHWLLFAEYVRREIAWSSPPNFDQSQLLDVAYRTYEHARHDGPAAALAYAWRQAPPTGATIHLEAALLFALTRPSRLKALGVNWLHLVLFQLALVTTLRARARGWALPALAVGLSWSAATTFHSVGGIDDFRIDFAALCLYGTFLAAVVRSDLFRRRAWALAAGGVAALCVLTRTLTSVYFAGLFALWMGALALRRWRAASAERRADLGRQLAGTAQGAACLALAALPALAARFGTIWNYYVGGHVSGPTSAVLADAAGRPGVWQVLALYPQNLLAAHLGMVLLALSLAVVGVLAACRSPQPEAGTPAAPAGVFTFVAASALVPLAVLTADSAKSPVAAGIVVGPFLWLVLLAAARLAPDAPRRLRGVLAGAVFCAGAGYQAHHLTGPANVVASVPSRLETVRFHDDIVRVARERGIEPRLLPDRRRDYVLGVRVSAYERHGVTLDTAVPLEHVIWAPETSEVLEALHSSTLVVLTTLPPPPGWTYPYDRKLAALEPSLRRYCASEMVEVGAYHVPEEIRLYARIARGTERRADDVGEAGRPR
jgi:hypothetical protein